MICEQFIQIMAALDFIKCHHANTQLTATALVLIRGTQTAACTLTVTLNNCNNGGRWFARVWAAPWAACQTGANLTNGGETGVKVR